MREIVSIVFGLACGITSAIFGGWDFALQALVGFIVIDYITGIMLAGIFKKSKKSASGALNSHTGFKGIVKKCVMMMLVSMGYWLDNVFGWDFFRQAIIFALLAREAISILENTGLMGIPMPIPLKQAIDILRTKGGDEDDDGSKK